jgi:hypothetical protein
VAPPSSDRNAPLAVATNTLPPWRTTSLIAELVESTSWNVVPPSVVR